MGQVVVLHAVVCKVMYSLKEYVILFFYILIQGVFLFQISLTGGLFLM